jgi:hypothetical protein
VQVSAVVIPHRKGERRRTVIVAETGETVHGSAPEGDPPKTGMLVMITNAIPDNDKRPRVEGHETHWAYCPQAKEWKGKSRATRGSGK